MPRPIDSLELFHAHALNIEREAMERYGEFRNYFRAHGEEVLAGLCDTIAQDEAKQYRRELRAAAGLTLPPVDDTRFHWLDAGAPDVPSHELFYRIANPRQLLGIALEAELGARRFYRWVARTSRNGGVRAIAQSMAREEADHARWVMNALQYREPALDWERMIESGHGPGTVTGG